MQANPRIQDAPVLETERLMLRGHRVDDFDDSAAMWGDPGVTRYIGGRPFTREESWSRLLRYAGHWRMVGYGYWAVVERGTGRFVGEVGFGDFRREIEPSFEGAPEAGWVLAPWAEGRGFATEAVNAVHAWADAAFDGRRTVCMITPENTASIRVAQKCGYRPAAPAVYKGAEVAVYERFRP